MAKLILGFIAGTALSALLTYFYIAPEIRVNYRAVGFNDGQIEARRDIAQDISRLLGTDLVKSEQTETLFNVKTTAVVVVERSGIRTLRVVE